MKKALALVLALAVAGACSSSSDDDGSGGSGGDGGGDSSGGKGGSASGGKGGSSSGGKGGSSSGGSGGGSASGGKGGSASGGAGGSASGGAGGSASGGAGGSASGGAGGSASGGAGGSASGGSGGSGGNTTDGCPGFPAMKAYGFEGDLQTWAHAGDRIQTPAVTASTAKARTGTGSIEISLDTANATATKADYFVGPSEDLKFYMTPGRTMKAWLWVPAGHQLEHVQLVAHSGAAAAGWKNAYVGAEGLTADAWNELTLTLPSDYACAAARAETAFFEFGVYFKLKAGATWSGKVYIDDVSVSARP